MPLEEQYLLVEHPCTSANQDREGPSRNKAGTNPAKVRIDTQQSSSQQQQQRQQWTSSERLAPQPDPLQALLAVAQAAHKRMEAKEVNRNNTLDTHCEPDRKVHG